MHAMKKKSLTATVCLLLEILLGVEDRAVIAFFANPKNHITTKAIEVTYGAKN
jgi:hypothetical protein